MGVSKIMLDDDDAERPALGITWRADDQEEMVNNNGCAMIYDADEVMMTRTMQISKGET